MNMKSLCLSWERGRLARKREPDIRYRRLAIVQSGRDARAPRTYTLPSEVRPQRIGQVPIFPNHGVRPYRVAVGSKTYPGKGDHP